MLKAGKKAPDFTLSDRDFKPVSLADFKGSKVVIYFYPRDDTPGCTIQACAFRDAYEGFRAKNITVIGISMDSETSHQKFAVKYNLPFILLADQESKVIKAYGVEGVLLPMRATFIIDENGVIEKVFEKATPDTNAADILEYLGK